MAILDAIDAEQAKMMNEPLFATTVSICSTVGAATLTGSATSCVGDQIEGSCVQASLPSATADSGPQSPACNKVDDPSNGLVHINKTQAEQSSVEYCANLISARIILDGNASPPKPGSIPNALFCGIMTLWAQPFLLGPPLCAGEKCSRARATRGAKAASHLCGKGTEVYRPRAPNPCPQRHDRGSAT